MGELTEQTKRLIAGDRSVRFGGDDHSEIGELGTALESFRVAGVELEERNWLRGNLADLSEALQQAVDLEDLARRLLGRLAPLLGLGAALFYLRDPNSGRLGCIGGWGPLRRANSPSSRSLEEGIRWPFWSSVALRP